MAGNAGDGSHITSLSEHAGAWRTAGAPIVSFKYDGDKTMTMVKMGDKTSLTFDAAGQAFSLEIQNPADADLDNIDVLMTAYQEDLD